MSAGDTVKRPSERSFGLTFGGLLIAAAAWWLHSGRTSLAIAAIVVAVLLVGAGLLRPSVLAVPNRLWFRLGMALNAVVSPIVLGTMFFVLVTPVGLVRRAFGADPLRMKPGRDLESYWVARGERPADQKPFAHQF